MDYLDMKNPHGVRCQALELLQEYPLVLTAGAGFMPYFHSEHRQLKTLRLIRPLSRGTH